MRNLSRYPIIGYGSGVVGVDELNAKVDDVWHGVLADSRAREEAGRILGIAPDDLERKFPTSPFEVRTNEAGLGPVETAILVFVGAVAYDLVKGVAKSAVKETLRILWQKVVKPQVENYLPLGAFGSEAYLDEPANYRLWRFSLRLNLHKVPQSKRNHIVEYLGLALEMCQGSRLDEIIAACERFIEHDDWKVLLNDLKTLTTAVQNVLQ